jgi:hypothetical protein
MFVEPSLPIEIFIFNPFGVIYPSSPTPALKDIVVSLRDDE